jgi:anti-sigma B factor antagonist
MGTQDFRISMLRPASGVIVAQVSGEIDLAGSNAFTERLLSVLDEQPARILVDLSKAVYVDTYILSALVEVAKSCRPEGCELAIVCSEGRMRRALATTGLDEFVATHDTLDEALSRDAPAS